MPFPKQPLDLEEYAKQRMLLNERALMLQEVGKKLGPDAHRKRDARSVKRFNRAPLLLLATSIATSISHAPPAHAHAHLVPSRPRSRLLLAACHCSLRHGHHRFDALPSASLALGAEFRQTVYFLERDWRRVKTAYKDKGGNPLKWMCQALCGLIAFVISIVW